MLRYYRIQCFTVAHEIYVRYSIYLVCICSIRSYASGYLINRKCIMTRFVAYIVPLLAGSFCLRRELFGEKAVDCKCQFELNTTKGFVVAFATIFPMASIRELHLKMNTQKYSKNKLSS